MIPMSRPVRVDLQYRFVMEVSDENKRLLRVYIVEPNEMQFYRTRKLHDRDHFIAKGLFAIEHEIAQYENRGLSQTQSGDLEGDEDALPTRVFVILSHTRNHFLSEIQVVNDIASDLRSSSLLDEMQLEQLARLVLDNEGKKKTIDKRGNYRHDIGFTGMCSTDSDHPEFQGMNVAKFTTGDDGKSGLPGDANLTVSLMNTATVQTRLVASLAERHGQSWSTDFVGNAHRLEHFCHRVARARGIRDYRNYVTAGNSLGVNVDLPGGFTSLLKRHTDQWNGRSPGHDQYWGVVLYFPMQFGDKEIKVRVNYGGYDRNHLCGVYRRQSENEMALSGYLAWKMANPDRYDVDPRVLLNLPEGVWQFTEPKADKRAYTSVFVDGLLKLGRMTNYDAAILYEAVLGMTLTPCQDGWYTGMMEAAQPWVRQGRNLLAAFAEVNVRDRGGVSNGDNRRRQPSSPGEAEMKRFGRSGRNMIPLTCLGRESDDTPALVKAWKELDTNGGVYGAGELIGQEQITAMAHLPGVMRHVHASRARVCKGTPTATALQEEYGMVNTEGRRAEALRYVALHSGDGEVVVENGWCEKFRSFKACDAFVGGMRLYDLREGRLMGTDFRGRREEVTTPQWRWDREDFSRAVRWWDPNVDLEKVSQIIPLTRGADES